MEAAVTPITPELESYNPLDGARLGAVETIRPDAVQSVVDDVATVQPFWAQLPLSDRARYMRRAAQAIIDQLDDLALLLSREQGKPINESYVMELLPTIDALRWLADAGHVVDHGLHSLGADRPDGAEPSAVQRAERLELRRERRDRGFHGLGL